EDEGLLPGRAIQPLHRFREMIAGLREDAARLGVKGLLTRTLEATGYAAALAQEPTQESQDRLENLAELLSAAADYEAREESPSLAGFLDRVSLLTDVDRTPGDAMAAAAGGSRPQRAPSAGAWLAGPRDAARGEGAPPPLRGGDGAAQRGRR